MKKIWFVDIDGVLCSNTFGAYERAVPNKSNIQIVNKLFDDGNEIVLWTARGTVLTRSKKAIKRLTKEQLKEWGVKYTKLKFGKPYYDYILDDKAVDIVSGLHL